MGKTIHLSLLDQVKVASPCPVRWEDMAGDDASRLCSQCNLHVHNLSAMGHDEAEAFLQSNREATGLCATFYRRADGTILTQDCPVGLAAVRERARWMFGRVAAAVAGVFCTTVSFSACTTSEQAPPGGPGLEHFTSDHTEAEHLRTGGKISFGP